MISTLSLVREAYHNATVENRYDFSQLSNQEIALDMIYCAADLEDVELADVEDAVAIVRKEFEKGN